MNEQIKKYVDPIKNFWGKLTKKVKIIIFSVLGGIVAISIVVGLIMNAPKYAVLYPKLDHQETIEVINELKDRNVDYQEENGTIKVPQTQENALRMELANKGYPKSAPNYNFFTENIDVMTTDYEKKTIEKYQMNQRLEAVIKTIDGVTNASVTISIPEESGYVWEEDKDEATASVAITLTPDKKLSESQVNGIKQLVAKSIPNLKTENVAIVDTATGEELNAKQNVQTDISTFKLEIEKQYETDIKKKVSDILKKPLGANNFSVSVKCIMNIDKKVQELITYKPATDDNKGVISESKTTKEQTTGGKNTGGVAGSQSNATASTTYPGIEVDGNTIYSKDDQSYKYLVSQVKEQIQGDAANVKDMTISVAVNQAVMDEQQKTEISKLVAFAAAIQPEKVAIYNSEFFGIKQTNVKPDDSPFMNPLTLIISGSILLLLLLLLFISILISNKRKKKLKLLMSGLEENAEGEQAEDLDADAKKVEKPPVISVEDIQALRDSNGSQQEALAKELQDFSSDNPEIAAQLIRTWLRGEDEND